jgi:hypothetical protein
MLAPFIGGQMEIQNSGEDYIFRGEVERAEVTNNELIVRFAWLGKNDGGPTRPSAEWTMNTRLDYSASLEVYVASDIGIGRIAIESSIIGELGVFFPKGYKNSDGEESKLDRSRIKGLT